MVDGIQALPLSELRKRKSTKWRLFPEEILPLPIAEMDFPIAEPIKSSLRDMIDRSDTGYLGSFPEMFQAFQKFADSKWNWAPDVSQMRFATDVGVGTVEVVRTLINPGDKVVLNSPVYDNMWRWVAEVKAELVDVPLIENGMQYSMDFAGLEQAYKSGAKVHILCNPHNPVGILYTKEELARIAELAKQYGVLVVSDEIHAALVYDPKKFFPFLSVSESAREVGITVTSASKAFNLAGLKCAMIITGNEKLQSSINLMPVSVAFRASLFGAVAATAAFSESTEWLDRTLRTLDENRRLLANLIETRIPAIGYRIPDFGYLAWLDLGKLGLGTDPAKTILEKGKLALNSGILYSPRHTNYARLNFGTSAEIISEAFDRIIKSL